jgi:Carboxypeptidase regulatory-like domain
MADFIVSAAAKGCGMKLVLGSTSRNHKACVRKRVPSVVRFTLAALLAAALLCVGWQPAFAQVSTGSISGSFADVQGGAIVGVIVKAVLVATNQEFTTISDSAGSFRLNALPIGIYRVEATKDGSTSVSVPGVEVAIAVDRGLGTIKLDVGEQTVSIEVSSGAPLVEQSEAQVTNTFSGAVLSTSSHATSRQPTAECPAWIPYDHRQIAVSWQRPSLWVEHHMATVEWFCG